jgi:predicted permease
MLTAALLERIAGIMVPVLTLVLVGWLYARRHAPDMAAVNRINVDVFSPALVLSALASRDFSIADNRWLLVAAGLVVLGSGGLAWLLARGLGWSARTFVPPMMFSNSGNMGLPLAVLAFGPGALAPAVAMFVVCNLLHYTLGPKIVHPKASLRELFLTPMTVAIVVGFALAASDLPRPPLVMRTLELIGSAMIPLMLFALGVRMVSVRMASLRLGLVGALVCPITGLIMAWLLDGWLPLTDAQRGMVYLFGSLPPAIFNFMLAERYGQEPELVAAIVLVGTLVSIIFIPVGLALGAA